MSIEARRKSRDESLNKADFLADEMFKMTAELAQLPDIEEECALGDRSRLDALYDTLAELRHTISGADQYQRLTIKPITASKTLPTLDRLMQMIKDDDIDSKAMCDMWGEVYGKFLAWLNKLQTSDNYAESENENHRNIVSMSMEALPNTVNDSGIAVYTKSSLVFTTVKSLTKSLSKYPREFEMTAYGGGYIASNQTVLGMHRDDKYKEAKISTALQVYRQLRKPMVNLLDNDSRSLPYFAARNNPLVFTWLFPADVYMKMPFKARSVQFNIAGPAPQQLSSQAKSLVLKEQRGWFELSLIDNRIYQEAEQAVHAAQEAGKHGLELSRYTRKRDAIRAKLLEAWREENK
jgi:hypothetical protein